MEDLNLRENNGQENVVKFSNQELITLNMINTS